MYTKILWPRSKRTITRKQCKYMLNMSISGVSFKPSTDQTIFFYLLETSHADGRSAVQRPNNQCLLLEYQLTRSDVPVEKNIIVTSSIKLRKKVNLCLANQCSGRSIGTNGLMSQDHVLNKIYCSLERSPVITLYQV